MLKYFIKFIPYTSEQRYAKSARLYIFLESPLKWTYSFNPKYTGALDEFDFSIKLSDGVIHTFTVTLRISYNGLKIDTYKNITGRNWDAITAELEVLVNGGIGVDLSYRFKRFKTVAEIKPYPIVTFHYGHG